MEATSINTSPKIAARLAYEHEYHRRPEVMEKKRQYSLAQSRARKVTSTKERFKEMTVEELLFIAMTRCAETGVSYDENKVAIETSMRILHGP